MRAHINEIDRLGLQILVVTFETAALAELYVRDTVLSWPLLLDPSRSLYAAYGMGRGRRWAIWGPNSWGVYGKLIRRGRRPQIPTGDIYQLGGDVLVEPEGKIALLHRVEGPADRQAVADLLMPLRT